MNKKITDLDIQALIDNELPQKQKEFVMKTINSDLKLRNRYSQLKRQKQNLIDWWHNTNNNKIFH